MPAPPISISVAMATFNGQRYIQRQLESLAAQSQVPAELVITDDGSEDNTLVIVDAFAKTASFPVYFYRNETRLGYSANFMRAANLCRSELIAFCDQDDYWYPQKIAVLVEPFSEPEVLLAYHNADVVNSEGIRINTLIGRGSRQSTLTPMSSSPWLSALGFTEVFRRSLLRLSDLLPISRNHHKINELMAHDQWVFFLASVFGRIAYIDQKLVAYVQHGSNTYGFWRELTFLDVLKSQLRDRSDQYSRYAKAAESRAAVLEIAMRNLEGTWSERAAAATEYYRRVSWLYAERNKLYVSAHLGDRLRAFRAILEKGGYTGAWGIKRTSILADMCVGVPIGHFFWSEPRLGGH
jgi:glycosyltransferase involved in cell wall biosynthesis